ncbi:hypothetical protein [Haliangium sp.]|uniref:hypothetical protein n=1 Tax=Haliangium sp. TaxID=2663208 RepID=UPI003D1315FF
MRSTLLTLLVSVAALAATGDARADQIAGPTSVRLGTNGAGAYVATRGVDDIPPLARLGLPSAATQWVTARFRPGSFFVLNPTEHVAVLLWGAPPVLPTGSPDARPVYGRGIILGNAQGCMGIGIERADGITSPVTHCTPVTFSQSATYEVEVHVSPGWVAYWLTNVTTGQLVAQAGGPIANPLPASLSNHRDILIGHTADEQQPRPSTPFEFYDLEDGWF